MSGMRAMEAMKKPRLIRTKQVSRKVKGDGIRVIFVFETWWQYLHFTTTGLTFRPLRDVYLSSYSTSCSESELLSIWSDFLLICFFFGFFCVFFEVRLVGYGCVLFWLVLEFCLFWDFCYFLIKNLKGIFFSLDFFNWRFRLPCKVTDSIHYPLQQDSLFHCGKECQGINLTNQPKKPNKKFSLIKKLPAKKNPLKRKSPYKIPNPNKQ